MAESVLQKKSFDFSLKIISLSQSLQRKKVEFVLCTQLIKSGTSVGALVYEAEFAQSRADFINKLSIALKEANETIYWLKLIRLSKFANTEEMMEEYNLLSEIKGMLIACIKTAKKNQTK
jgi:four helix bundle protein